MSDSIKQGLYCFVISIFATASNNTQIFTANERLFAHHVAHHQGSINSRMSVHAGNGIKLASKRNGRRAQVDQDGAFLGSAEQALRVVVQIFQRGSIGTVRKHYIGIGDIGCRITRRFKQAAYTSAHTLVACKCKCQILSVHMHILSKLSNSPFGNSGTRTPRQSTDDA